jgi:hypothetical protein
MKRFGMKKRNLHLRILGAKLNFSRNYNLKYIFLKLKNITFVTSNCK